MRNSIIYSLVVVLFCSLILVFDILFFLFLFLLFFLGVGVGLILIIFSSVFFILIIFRSFFCWGVDSVYKKNKIVSHLIFLLLCFLVFFCLGFDCIYRKVCFLSFRFLLILILFFLTLIRGISLALLIETRRMFTVDFWRVDRVRENGMRNL